MEVYKLENSLSKWVILPWILIGTPGTRVHDELLSGKFFVIGQLTGVGNQAVSSGTWRTLFLPGREVPGSLNGHWILHPLDHLGLGDEVNFWMVGQDFINPVEEGIQEFWIVLQP